MANKITTSKILKNGKIQFYTGGKKATDTEIKKFISNNYKAIKPDTLSGEYKKYLGKVKGGKARYENSISDKSGKFITNSVQAAAFKRIDIEAIKKAKKLETIRDVFKNNAELKAQFDKIINQTGVHIWYNSHAIIDRIKTYNGETITINGKEVSKLSAVRKLREFISKARRTYGAQDMAVKLSYIGVDKLAFNLPDSSDFESEDPSDFNEAFLDDIILYVSEPKKTNKSSKAPKKSKSDRRYSSKRKKK